MKKRTLLAGAIGAIAFGAALTGGASLGNAACDASAADDLSFEDAQAVYDCLKDEMLAGYKKGPKRWIPEDRVNDFRSWTPANTLPANPGFHGGRYLLTWVNEVGAEEYLKYKDEDVQIPAGTIIAKESFSVSDSGKVSVGPLFFMEKTEAGKSPETMDWYYYAVAANGAPMGVNVFTACSECHMENFGFQGGLGYPVEEVRIGAN